MQRGIHRRVARAAILLGERHEQDRIRHRNANRHDRAHERLNVQTRARQQQHEQHSADHRGYRRKDDERQLQRLKVRRKQQIDHQHREQQTHSKIRQRLFHRTDLTADGDLHAARQFPGALDGAVQFRGNPSKVFARNIRGQRHQAVVLADNRSVSHLRHVPHQRMGSSA